MPKDAAITRDRIVAAASRLFYGHGIRAVSVDDVAARAGLTKRTLYYHFRSKDDLIAAYLAARDEPTIVIVKVSPAISIRPVLEPVDIPRPRA